MVRNDQADDRGLLQKVNQKLTRTGTSSQTRVLAAVLKGEVTLTGTLANEMQRRALIRAASSVAGVRRVVDRMLVQAKKNAWQ